MGVQWVLTVLIAAPIYQAGKQFIAQNQWMLDLSMVAMMMTMVATCCCRKALRTFPTNYAFLFAITCAMSVIVGFSSAMYSWQSVLLCAGITCGIFLAMTVYAWTTKSDFTGAGPYLFAAMIGLMMFDFAVNIMGMCGVSVKWAMMAKNLCGVLLFTFYIVYDTQLIMGERVRSCRRKHMW